MARGATACHELDRRAFQGCENPLGSTQRQARGPEFAVSKGAALRFASSMQDQAASIILGFGDCDPAGVIFYPRVFALAHAALEEFLAVKVGREAWFASPSHAFPVRQAEAEFHAPMRPGEMFRLAVAVEKVGGTSIAFAVEFLNSDGRVAARVRSVHVALDRDSGKPAPIPGKIRSALERAR
jgi:4-hydroxybenzoyl-CoA thioesterase